MAINLSDNIKVQAPKPGDSRYLNITVPYSGTSHVNFIIPTGERFPGLTVLINGTETSGVNKEYWYKAGVTDPDLVLKSLGGTSVLTGATNGLTLINSGTTVSLGGTLTGNTIFYGGPATLQYGGDYSAFYTDRSLVDKGYANAILSGLKPKQAVNLATTSNITLSGNQTIDGYMTTDGMRILVKNQNNSTTGDTANGVYSASTGVWSRTEDFDGTPFGEVESGSYMFVLSGNTNANSSWVLATPDPIVVGVTPLQFVLFNHVSDVLGGPGIIVTQSGGTHTVCVNAVNGLTATMGGVALGGTLTGSTVINDSRSITKGIEYGGNYNSGFTNCSLVTKEYVQGLVSSGGTYSLSSPATKCVGGVCVGEVLTGKTAFQLLQEILAPELFGVITAPSETIALNPSTALYEIGCSIATLCVTGTFNCGSISPQYCSASSCRSGLANAYSFTGCQMPVGFQLCAGSSMTACATAYSVIGGSQTWSVCTRYNCGVQPKGSSGTNYCSPLVSGCTSAASTSITGILPWYWGLSTSGIVDATCVANCGCSATCGCKCLANVTASPISITFNSCSTDFIWFALPSCAATKTCWYVNGTNNGAIGGVGNLFATFCTLAITSVEGCWAGCNYEVYVSCLQTGTDAGVPMCIS